MEIPFTATPGPLNAAAELDSDKPVDFFGLIMTDELLDLIVRQTNLYARETIAAMPVRQSSRVCNTVQYSNVLLLPNSNLSIFL